jgi:hypothetical protein
MVLPKIGKNGFRAAAAIIIFGLSVSILINCQKDKAHPRSYPQVKTNPVTNITDKGATFGGDIYTMGTEPIIDHGFVWSSQVNPDLMDDKIFLGSTTEGGVYTADINTTLAKDVKYYVKAFIKTNEHIVFGLPVEFVSLGSGAPVITGFKPDSAAWLDTLTISGKNFSRVLSTNIVRIGTAKCDVVAATDTTISVLVNTGVATRINNISIEISGNVSEFTAKSFSLIMPVLSGFTPTRGYWGDTVVIQGKHLKTIRGNATNYLKIGSATCTYVTTSDTSIKVKVPNEVNAVNNSILIGINGISLICKSKFELRAPYFTFSPETGTWGNTITMTGRLNGLSTLTSISFVNAKDSATLESYDILSVTNNSVKIRVPTSLLQPATVIKYSAIPFKISSADTFRLFPPVIRSFSPTSGAPGTSVTIKGNYFKLYNTQMFFGNVAAYIYGINDSIIQAYVPAGCPEISKIRIIVGLQEVVSSGNFTAVVPKITSISPLSGTFNDEITITGENFDSPSVNLGNYWTNIVSATSTKIVFQVPVSIDSVPTPITVTTGTGSVTSDAKFTLLPPVINSISPSGSVTQGQDITISGNNFNPYTDYPGFNKVYLDNYALTVKSANKTTIVATLPNGLPRETANLKIIVGGYTRYSAQSLTINSQWLKLASPEIPSTIFSGYWAGMKIYGANINNNGILTSEPDGSTYRFNPVGNVWTKLNIGTPFDMTNHNLMMGQCVLNDTMYLIGGHYSYSMKAFDESHGTWRTLATPPQLSGVAFAINNKIYFGLNWNSAYNLEFYESDPANGYTWVRKGDFPFLTYQQFSAYFTVGNMGYVVFADNSVYQYNPVGDQWTRVADFPGAARLMAFSFVLNGHGYIGGGGNPYAYTYELYNDVWSYDPVGNNWTLATYMPGPRQSAVAFTIGSKAYVGFGLNYVPDIATSMYDFFEFDPNFSGK